MGEECTPGGRISLTQQHCSTFEVHRVCSLPPENLHKSSRARLMSVAVFSPQRVVQAAFNRLFTRPWCPSRSERSRTICGVTCSRVIAFAKGARRYNLEHTSDHSHGSESFASELSRSQHISLGTHAGANLNHP